MSSNATSPQNRSVVGYDLETGSRALVNYNGNALVATVETPQEALDEALVIATFDRHPSTVSVPVGAVVRELDNEGDLLGVDGEGAAHVYYAESNTIEVWDDEDLARASLDRAVNLDEGDRDARKWTAFVADVRGWRV